MVDVSIITVTHNSKTFLKEYLASIERQKLTQDEVVLVDSGSTDGTVEEIQKLKRKVILIRNKTNVGFAAGNNIGAKNARGTYLLFLNPDTRLEVDCLKHLLEEATRQDKKDFFLLPRQKNYKTGEFLLDGVCVDIFGYPYKIYNAEQPQKTKSPFYCDGAAVFLPKRTFEKLGKFDEKMFMFNEDIDLSWKAHLFAIPFISVPDAHVLHYSGGSMEGGIRKGKKYRTTYLRRYLGERNAIRNILKNYRWYTLVWVLPFYLLINLCEIIIFALFKEFKASLVYLRAWGWNISQLPDTMKKRRWIQERRRVNDWKILSSMYIGSGKLNAFLSIKIPQFK